MAKSVGSPATSTRQWWAPQPTARCSIASARGSQWRRTTCEDVGVGHVRAAAPAPGHCHTARVSTALGSGRLAPCRPTSTSPPRCATRCVAADFTYDRVAEAIGEDAHRALGRNETTPGAAAYDRRVGRSTTLVRLFLLQTPGGARTPPTGRCPGWSTGSCDAGLLEQSVGEVAARTSTCRPYADRRRATCGSSPTWARPASTVSSWSPAGDDHVLGVGRGVDHARPAHPARPVGATLHLGTGCGVQALHRPAHRPTSSRPTSTARLCLTRLTAGLNVRRRSRCAPGRCSSRSPASGFDPIATNPPYVISPAAASRRPTATAASPSTTSARVCATGAPSPPPRRLAARCSPTGRSHRGPTWGERVERAGCATTATPSVVQREVLDPASYVALWLKDAGHHGGTDYTVRYDAWLALVRGAGRRGRRLRLGQRPPRHGRGRPPSCLEWPYEVEQPIGRRSRAGVRRSADLRGSATTNWLDTHLVAARTSRQETVGRPGAEDPEAIVLRQQRGFRRARTADTLEAAFLGACDGDLTVGRLLAALAALLERDDAELRTTYLPVVRSSSSRASSRCAEARVRTGPVDAAEVANW